MPTKIIPKKLYKYRAFDTLALRIITSGDIYYADPRTFNDPMDCDPTIEVDTDIEALRNLYTHLYLSTRSREFRSPGEIEYLSTEYDSGAEQEAALIHLFASETKNIIDAELGLFGVLSLSATWNSPLMWSHYADQHQGICIEFDTTDTIHRNLNPINYRSSRSIKTSELISWKILNSSSAKRIIEDGYFFSKSPQWGYEKEWRDINAKSGIHRNNLRITGIYFGMKCDIAVITSIVRLLANEPYIGMYEIYPRGHTFKLDKRLTEREEIMARQLTRSAIFDFKDVIVPPVPTEAGRDTSGQE